MRITQWPCPDVETMTATARDLAEQFPDRRRYLVCEVVRLDVDSDAEYSAQVWECDDSELGIFLPTH